MYVTNTTSLVFGQCKIQLPQQHPANAVHSKPIDFPAETSSHITSVGQHSTTRSCRMYIGMCVCIRMRTFSGYFEPPQHSFCIIWAFYFWAIITLYLCNDKRKRWKSNNYKVIFSKTFFATSFCALYPHMTY